MINPINIVGDGLVADDQEVVERHAGRVISYSVGQRGMILHAEFANPHHAASAKRELERGHLRIAA